MKRYYEKYTEWEDFKNGMYELSSEENDKLILLSCNLLSDKTKFLNACNLVIEKWKISTKVHLTNNSINKKAWLGQAACSLMHNVPELLTKVAWGKLDFRVQNTANEVAYNVINSYLLNLKNENNSKLY